MSQPQKEYHFRDFWRISFEFIGAAQIINKDKASYLYMHASAYCVFHGYESFIKGCYSLLSLNFDKTHAVKKLSETLFKKISYEPDENDNVVLNNLHEIHKNDYFRYPAAKTDKTEKLVLMMIPEENVTETHKYIENTGRETDSFLSETVVSLIIRIGFCLPEKEKNQFIAFLESHSDLKQKHS